VSEQLSGLLEPAGELEPSAETHPPDGKFRVRLVNFEGPFDLLLTLIGRRQLDVTEVALSQVTDDFIAHLAAAGDHFDLGQATEFLVVAATLLDLKAARLLPAADVEDEEDLALLEARDLLFARLLQYRAYKLAAAHLLELEQIASRRYRREVELEDRFAQLSPELRIGVDRHQFAAIAAAALKPKPTPVVEVDHIHAPRVSVRAECETTLDVVARFLGLLEMYREGDVAFDQAAALAELRVRWIGEADDARRDESADRDPAAEQELGAQSDTERYQDIEEYE
jgi:segregation and condensation protein A